MDGRYPHFRKASPNIALAARLPPIQTSDPFELILSRAAGVKRLGENRAIFKAPTREERTASVSLTRAAGGCVLLHDFGGDSAADILGALGLTLASLYPARERRKMTTTERAELRIHSKMAGWAAALNALTLETKIVNIFARDLLANETPVLEDLDRLALACSRIDAAQGVLCGR